MKILPNLFSMRNILQNKIEKRNVKRIEEYITCSANVRSEQLRRNLDTIARFAEKKNCNLAFTPGTDLFQNSINMDVYKRGTRMMLDGLGMPLYGVNAESLSGKAILPKTTNDREFLKAIKSLIKGIIANDKKWNQKIF